MKWMNSELANDFTLRSIIIASVQRPSERRRYSELLWPFSTRTKIGMNKITRASLKIFLLDKINRQLAMLPNNAILETSSSWDGTLSPSEFVAASHGFVEKWKRASHHLPPWSWLVSNSSPLSPSHQDGGYLAMEMMPLFKPIEVDDFGVKDSELGESSCFSDVDLADNATLVEHPGIEVHYYDFHIVYSSSYRVPVMYFRGYRTDGQQLVLEEIEKDLPSSTSKVLTESKWTFITQTEHPYLNRPWFTLHPCGTNDLMRLLLHGDALRANLPVSAEEYLVSWLSVVGQVVGIKVPLQLAN